MRLALRKQNTSLYARLIRWWTHGPYNHAELILARRHDGTVLCGSATADGVRLKWLHLNPDHWDLLDIPGDQSAARRWFDDHLGQKYDWLGVLGFVIRRGRHKSQRWFCSEACAAALGIPDPWRFCPNTLAAVARYHLP